MIRLHPNRKIAPMFSFQGLPIPAILVATLVAFSLGFLWYYKIFAKPWMAAMGLKQDDIDGSGIQTGRALASSFLASLFTVLGTALLLAILAPAGLGSALILGLVVWLAYSITPVFKLIFWEDRPTMLVVIDGGYELTSILLAVLILTLWPW